MSLEQPPTAAFGFDPTAWLDVDISKVDWVEFARLQQQALAVITVATPTPLDDLGLKWAAEAFTEWVKARVSPPTMKAEPFFTADGIDEQAAKAGIPAKLPPFVTNILLNLAASVVERLLERWAKQQA